MPDNLRGFGEIVIDELSPLHQRHGVLGVRVFYSRYSRLVNTLRDPANIWKFFAALPVPPWRGDIVVVFWREKAGLLRALGSVVRILEIVAPTIEGAVPGTKCWSRQTSVGELCLTHLEV